MELMFDIVRGAVQDNCLMREIRERTNCSGVTETAPSWLDVCDVPSYSGTVGQGVVRARERHRRLWQAAGGPSDWQSVAVFGIWVGGPGVAGDVVTISMDLKYIRRQAGRKYDENQQAGKRTSQQFFTTNLPCRHHAVCPEQERVVTMTNTTLNINNILHRGTMAKKALVCFHGTGSKD